MLQVASHPDAGLLETLGRRPEVRLLKGARNPETFLQLYEERPPDLVLVELNGVGAPPEWLEGLLRRLPGAEVMICSQSRDPDFLIQVMKLRVGGFMPLPLKEEDLLATLERLRAARTQYASGLKCQVLMVTGTKGGVGVTTVATNLAVALARQRPGSVLLMDLARPFPQVGQFLDLKSSHTILDLVESVDSLDPLFIKKVVQKHPSGLEVVLGQPLFNLDSGEMLHSRSLKRIFETFRNLYHWLVVDVGSWLDLFYIHLLREADRIVLVTQLTVPDLQNLKLIRTWWRDWDLDEKPVQIVVNRYEKSYLLGLRDLANLWPQPQITALPVEAGVLEAINMGTALEDAAPRSKLWRKLKELAAELVSEQEKEAARPSDVRPGFFRRLLFKEE